MSLIVIGLSHKTAPEDLREKASIPDPVLPDLYSKLLALFEVDEAVVLSTCNRTEVYANVTSAESGIRAIEDAISEVLGLSKEDRENLLPHIYTWQSEDMVYHLFTVVSSLDSLVLGETQILAQTRRAYSLARSCGACADIFKHLFPQAFAIGKRARTETAISQNSVSVSTTAVNLAKEVFDDIKQCSVLVVGAGEMGELTANYLAEQGVRSITVTNRTYQTAAEIAQRIHGSAVPFDQLTQAIAAADIVISSTAAPGYVITPDIAREAATNAGEGTCMLIDIALPRDIDPAVGEIDGYDLFDLDDFGSIIDSHIAEREEAAEHVRTMVSEGTNEFLRWMQERRVVPTITHLYAKMDRICETEADEAARQLAAVKGRPLSPDELEVVRTLANAVGKKIMHGPVVRLRKQATNPDAYRYTEAARFLFGLDSNPLGKQCRDCQYIQECGKGKYGYCLIARLAGFPDDMADLADKNVGTPGGQTAPEKKG